MLPRILWETVRRRKRRVAMAVLAVLLGSSLAAALFGVAADLEDKVARELRSYGANILVTPQAAGLQIELGGVTYSPVEGQALLDETNLARLKTIFWRNNVVGFAPYLSAPVTVGGDAEPVALTGTWFEHEVRLPAGTALVTGTGQQGQAGEETVFKTGVKAIAPWWRLRGDWVAAGDPEGSIVGAALAERLKLHLGDRYTIRYRGQGYDLKVAGIVTTGGYEDGQIFVDLPVAQRLLGVEKGVSRVLVSALTIPKEKLPADIRDKRPEEMTPKEYDKWYCSPTVDAVVTQIKEAIPGSDAKAVRQFSEQEGAFSTKVQLLLVLVTAVALVASGLGVMATMTTLVLERRAEIGLMKAIGAEGGQVAAIFLVEAALIGLLGGGLGYLAGVGLARYIGERVFDTPITPGLIVLPVTLLLAVGVAVLGSALPVRRAVALDPASLLGGR